MANVPLTLRKGPLLIELAPEVGGSVSRFAVERGGRLIELFRPMPGSAIAEHNPLFASCFPLVPLSNRVENGRYTFQGRSFVMTPNLPLHPHPLHGHGWRGVWKVAGRSEASATLRFDYGGEEWPSSYTATQHIELSADRLVMTIALENSGTSTMPAGIGLHPFFPRTETTSLTAELGGVWLAREDQIPVERVALPERWDFRRGLRVHDLDLDNCFDGWSGHALVRWPEAGIELTIDADPLFSHAVIYAPPGKPFFCFEPVSHANLALNFTERGRTDLGLHTLEPGDALEGQVRFSLTNDAI